MIRTLIRVAVIAYFAQAAAGFVAGAVAAWSMPDGQHALQIIQQFAARPHSE